MANSNFFFSPIIPVAFSVEYGVNLFNVDVLEEISMDCNNDFGVDEIGQNDTNISNGNTAVDVAKALLDADEDFGPSCSPRQMTWKVEAEEAVEAEGAAEKMILKNPEFVDGSFLHGDGNYRS